MAATVLGKRARSAAEPEALPVRTASKRRTVAPRARREDAAVPKSIPRTRSRAKLAEPLADQENGDITKTADKALSKHTIHEEQGGSPSKINSHFRTSKLVEEETPTPVEFKTPQKARFRDALQQSPSTPRHRVQVGAKAVTPRTPRHANLPPTPRQSATPTAAQSVYSQARQLFARGANSGRLVGRETEREKVATFIEDCVKTQKGGCLYISGPPGTGKSAMVNEVCQDMDLSDVKVSHVNCVSMRNARDVYSKLIQDFDEDSDVFKKSEGDRLKDLFVPSKPNGLFLVSLDEMDHLLMGDSGVLQSLFEWSLSNKSTLILIGIANALDLTDRSLPQLKAKNLRPILLPFLPYNAASIANVITKRLRSLIPVGMGNDPKFVPFLQPAAIQLCAKKVASQTGDLRKAFELIKRAVDTIEQETQQKLEKQAAEAESNPILAENANLSLSVKAAPAPQPTIMSSYTVLTAPRASIAHIARITTSAFGQGTVQRLKGLNLQQKAAICALITLERKRRELDIMSTPSKSRCSAPTVKQAFDTYCTLCRNDNILHPLTSTEFKDVLSNLETMGLVGEYQGRGRGGTVAGGSDIRRTPSKSGSVISTPQKGMDEQGLLCFVSQSEIEGQIAGPGEGILRRLLRGEGL
ncbi:putative cell division control protein Cdc6 [Penicillium brasilianum]|uniref:Cell division control protein n=1 Tax=Penicillium brasilianum TaxID=104259 RepID=A0A1S9RZ73_PENBI|nr:putative cell division control protein Cdc6 [Penicillium brasilianum]